MPQFVHVMRVGIITAPVIETGVIQQMQIKTSPFEVRDNINSMQFFGFASSPLPGCHIVALNIAADNANGNVIGSNDPRYRPKGMAGGETMLYDSGGQQVYLSNKNGKLSITIAAGQEVDITASSAVNITAPNVTINGNLTVNGTITATGDIRAGNISLETHRHTGVQNGGGSSGGPI
jgi:phage baseplate assembly protein V